MVPGPGSGVPGAPAGDYDHIPDGMEQHSPVLFLDLNADDLSTGELTVTSVQKSDDVLLFLKWPFEQKMFNRFTNRIRSNRRNSRCGSQFHPTQGTRS